MNSSRSSENIYSAEHQQEQIWSVLWNLESNKKHCLNKNCDLHRILYWTFIFFQTGRKNNRNSGVVIILEKFSDLDEQAPKATVTINNSGSQSLNKSFFCLFRMSTDESMMYPVLTLINHTHGNGDAAYNLWNYKKKHYKFRLVWYQK